MRPCPASRLLVLFLALAPAAALAGPTPALLERAESLFRQYLAIDTTNPPGREMSAARFLAGVLEKEGLEPRILDLGGERANLIARLRGTGSKRPVILLHHMDVVPAAPARWTSPPFGGKVVDGHLVGRGTVDIKGKGIIDLMTMLHMARLGRPLSRDFVFLAVADEECDSLGSRRMVAEHAELIRDAEFLIDEGGEVRARAGGRPVAYLVAIGEKIPLWLTVTFSGKAGHGSEPDPDSAVNRLVRAAKRLEGWRTPPRLRPELKEHVRLLLRDRKLEGLPGWTGDFASSAHSPAFLDAIARLDTEVNAAVRDTVSLTGLRAGEKINTIPGQASMTLDCRLFPDTPTKAFQDELRRVLADPTATIRLEDTASDGPRPGPSRVDSDFMRALTQVAARRDPGVPVVPFVMLSSNDSTFYRPLGIQAYGFEYYRLTEDERSSSHGDDERLSLESFRDGLRLACELMEELSR
ncbi:MAG: M20/M25/M40 family metallo-hydrolase [Candidatus Riflebacteria bacterium]|nr:M20/M25/M40 family metallo-hydrolase [Candidatus Riflebacteria bacterium]